jgi:hypothetical protein
MGNNNMFCYFAERPVSLRKLIKTMHRVMRVHYQYVYEQLNGQFCDLAKHFYGQDIPAVHPVWAEMRAYDAAKNMQALKRAKLTYDKLSNLVINTGVGK